MELVANPIDLAALLAPLGVAAAEVPPKPAGGSRGFFDVRTPERPVGHFRYWDERSHREAEAKAHNCARAYPRAEVKQVVES